MKKIEDIEKEYEIYEIETECAKESYDDFLTYMEVGIDDTKIAIKDVIKEINIDRKYKLLASIRNLFSFVFLEEDTLFYNEDIKILEEELDLSVKYFEYYEQIKELSTEENYIELLKLVDFSALYYNEHLSYLESRRDSLEMITKGYRMYNNKYADNREVFNSFITERISRLSTPKKVEKVKKI